MLRIKRTLPLLSSLMLTSLAYGQSNSTIWNPMQQNVNFIDGDNVSLKSRLQAASTYNFLNGAYAASDSMRVYHTEGKNSLSWLSVDPFNILNVAPGNDWLEIKNNIANSVYKNIDTLYNFFWSPSLNNWDVNDKLEITDIVGNTTIARTLTENNASLMELKKRTYEMYNENGVLDSAIIEVWNNNDWEKFQKATYLYDTLGNEIGLIYSHFNVAENNWNDLVKYEVTNVDGKLVSLNSLIPDTAGEWMNSTSNQYFYDAAGNMTRRLSLESDSNFNWVESTQIQYLYNAAGQLVQTEYTVWDAVNFDWVSGNKNIYAYDSVGNLVSKVKQNYNGSLYINTSKENLLYTNDVLTSVEYSNWAGIEWNTNNRINIVDTRVDNGGTVMVWEQDWNTGAYWETVNNNAKTTYYFEEYNDDGTKIPTIKANQISLYPNPTANEFTIEVAQAKIEAVHIYNVTGALVMSVRENAAQKATIDIASLQSGMYQVQVITNTGVGTQKLNVVK